MAPKNPVGRLAETALSTLKDPKGAAGRVVGQAKGAVALGKIAADTAGSVVGRAARKGKAAPARPQAPTPQARQESPAPGGLRAVPDVNEPAHTQPPVPEAKKPAAPKPAAAKPAARKSADSPKKQGDPVAKAPAKKSAPKKPAPKKSPATKKVAATPADVAEVVEAAVAEDPKKTAAQPAKKAASPTAKKGAAKKTPAKKSSPGGKLPARKSPAAGGSGTNPSTGKPSATQAGEGSVVDPSVAKQVGAESETLKKAAETDPS